MYDPLQDLDDVQCYADEAGTSDSSITVLAGVVFRAKQARVFSADWQRLVAKHKLRHIHMRELTKRTAISVTRRRQLLLEAAGLINLHKHSSVSVHIDADQYRRLFGPIFRGRSMSIYGSCFVLFVAANARNAAANSYCGCLNYILDKNERHASHILGAATGISKLQAEGKSFNFGQVVFADDFDTPALQAADLVAYTALKSVRGLPFKHGCEPLLAILEDAHSVATAPTLWPVLAEHWQREYDLS